MRFRRFSFAGDVRPFIRNIFKTHELVDKARDGARDVSSPSSYLAVTDPTVLQTSVTVSSNNHAAAGAGKKKKEGEGSAAVAVATAVGSGDNRREAATPTAIGTTTTTTTADTATIETTTSSGVAAIVDATNPAEE